MGDDEEQRKSTWEKNHIIIQNAFVDLYKKLGKPPTNPQIAEECQLSVPTVQKHFKDLKLDNITPQLKARATRVLHGIANKGEKGDASCAKLFFQLVFGWSEKTGIDLTGDIKTETAVFISPDTFDSVEEWEEHQKKKKEKKEETKS